MSMAASIYPISAELYDAARCGDAENFKSDSAPGFVLEYFWHAIHYLVTGDSTVNFLLSGTQAPQISYEDYHCKLHAPKDIELLHRRLGKRSVEDIMSAFDPVTFNQLDIYPRRWSIEARSYIETYLEEFLSKLRQAADGKLGFIITIT